MNEETTITDNRDSMSNNTFERHAQTALTSLVVLLLAGVVAFIFKINDNQVEQLIELRSLQFQLNAIADLQKGGNGYIEREIKRVDLSINTIWPRIRVTAENMEILKRHIETMHPSLDIQLNDPEKF